MSRLKETYQNEIVDAMIKKFGYKNIMEVPKLDKIVINMGVGEAKENAKILESAMKDLEIIAGQKPITTKAKNSIANFKIREGMPIGCKVTLRGEKMYEFLDRLVNLALPRVRDFRGVNPNAFDGRGNYALGIKEQLIFPEIEQYFMWMRSRHMESSRSFRNGCISICFLSADTRFMDRKALDFYILKKKQKFVRFLLVAISRKVCVPERLMYRE